MNQTIFITGAAGFIGSHLSELLIERGYRVLGLDDLSTGSYENIRQLMGHPSFHFARADIRNEMIVDRMASEADAIIHLAAAVGVELIVRKPVQTIETNIMGTEVILKASLRYNARILLASTSEVYGKGSRIPFTENDDVLLGATSHNRWSYAASKMVDEFLGLAYAHEYGLQVVPFRLFNTVGPRQTGQYGMVVPRFVRWALEGAPIQVYGDGTQSRCFCHVADVVTGIAALLEHPEAAGQVFNLGSRDKITIRELAETIRQRTGSASEILLVPYSEAYEPGFEDMREREPDLGRIAALTGWAPERSLDQILDDVIAFERKAQKDATRTQ